MIFKSEDFTAESGNIYVVDASVRDVTVMLPDTTELQENMPLCAILKKGAFRVRLQPVAGQMVNDSEYWDIPYEWRRGIPTVGNGSWYIL